MVQKFFTLVFVVFVVFGSAALGDGPGEAVQASPTVVFEVTPAVSSHILQHRVTELGDLCVYATCSALDLTVQILDEAGEVVNSDDDSGGGTTPFLRFSVGAGDLVTIQFTAENVDRSVMVSAHIVEVSDSEESDLALLTLRQGARQARALARRKDHATARSVLGKAITDATGATQPPFTRQLERQLLAACDLAYQIGDLEAARAGGLSVLASRKRSLPQGHPELLSAQHDLAVALSSLGAHERARELQEIVLSARTMSLPPEHKDVQSARNNLALTLMDLGAIEEARQRFEEVVAVLERTCPQRDSNLQAARVNLASTLRKLGDLKRARELEEQVLGLYEQTLPLDHTDLQRVRVNLAATMRCLGKPEVARELVEQAVAVLASTLQKSHPTLLKARHNLALTLMALGDPRTAEELLAEVLALRKKTLPDQNAELLETMASLATVHFRMGKIEAAREVLEAVMRVHERVHGSDHLLVAAAKDRLGVMVGLQGHTGRARELFDQALAAYSRVLPPSNWRVQIARNNLANLLYSTGEFESARDLFQQVLSSYEATFPPDHRTVREVRANLVLTLARLGDVEATRQHVSALTKSVTDNLRWYADRISPREVEGMVIGSRWEMGVVLSILDAPGFGTRELLEEAFSMTECLRAASVAQRRLMRAASSLENDDGVLSKLQSRIRAAHMEVARLAQIEPSGESYREAVLKKDRILREYWSQLSGRPGIESLTPRTRPEEIGRTLGEGEVAVAYLRYPRIHIDPENRRARGHGDHYLAFVLHKDKPLAKVELGPALRIDEAVQAWKKRIVSRQPGQDGSGDPENTLRARGTQLRRLVFDPLKAHLQAAASVVVALDDVLHAVPLDALPCESGVVLGETLRFHYRTSLKELTIRTSARTTEPTLLALGGVDFDASSMDRKRVAIGHGRRGSRGVPRSITTSLRFDPLPATQDEVERIATCFREAYGKDASSSVMTGPRASRSAFEMAASRATFVHVATHGYTVSDLAAASMRDHRVGGLLVDPLALRRVRGYSPLVLCGLAFAGANVAPREAWLTAEEMASLDLNRCELVVLSACSTNVGVRRSGQGIASLQQSLDAAGARSTLTSLWQVDDEATSELMARFYHNLWIKKMSKAEALWQAKLELRRSGKRGDTGLERGGRDKSRPLDVRVGGEGEDQQGKYQRSDYSDPYFWAGYVLLGDPE